MVYNENVFYLLYSWTNAITGKNVVPEIWAKIHLTNQIGSISRTKLLNSLICMLIEVDENLQFLFKMCMVKNGRCKKWAWPLRSQGL